MFDSNRAEVIGCRHAEVTGNFSAHADCANLIDTANDHP